MPHRQAMRVVAPDPASVVMFGAEPVASLELLLQRLWKLASPDILHRGQCHARSMSDSGDGDDDRLESTSTRTFAGSRRLRPDFPDCV